MTTATLDRRISGLALANDPKPGMKLVDLGAFGFIRDLAGADEHGYNQLSDVLVTQTVDGVDYNQLYREFQETIRLQNAERTAIMQFLTYQVTNPTESVSQLSGSRFEKATEYGEPRGARLKPTTFWLGFGFEQWDIAARYTYQFLINATAAQVTAIHSSIIEADNQLQYEEEIGRAHV